ARPHKLPPALLHISCLGWLPMFYLRLHGTGGVKCAKRHWQEWPRCPAKAGSFRQDAAGSGGQRSRARMRVCSGAGITPTSR
ncbi:MAG: hypothetical protein SCM57_11345, partial [Bacillota bacterium]|nr:hypothetical protein [Bacillota bacterium]